MSYEIPSTLAVELNELESYIDRYKNGELDATTLKARRVPFGCYEQREDGTYMVRIRATGGAITPLQLRAIGEIALRYGTDSVHITTREEFQIHDVSLDQVTAIMRDLMAVGLATRGGGGNTVRNIVVSPDSGVAVDEVFDPSPYAFALTTRLIAESDSWTLPRKYKIAFSNSAADTAYAQFTDLGFIAHIQDGVKGFKVYVAGGFGAKPSVGHLLHAFLPGEEIYHVAEAIKRLFDQHGNRKNRHAARLRFLWNSLGEAKFRELYKEQLVKVKAEKHPAVAVQEIPQEGRIPLLSPLAEGGEAFARWKKAYVMAQRQSGLFSVTIPIFLGNLEAKSLVRLATFLEPFGENVVRATMGQNLRLRNIPENYLGNVYELSKEMTALTDEAALVGNSIACTGADTCKLGICLSKGALSAIARRLKKSDLDWSGISDFRLNLSGCPNTCGQHILADLGFYGNVGRKDQQMFPAYAIVAGARLQEGEARLAQAIDRISARELPNFVADVLTTWLQKRSSYKSFADYLDHDGAVELKEIAQRYKEVPLFEDDKNYYYDWGAQEVFSLVGKGVGECSAGLFDLIEVDLKNARQQWNELESASDEAQALYRVTLYASRALLITRAVEAESDHAVFVSFRKHFVAVGLIDAKFDVLLARAQESKTLIPKQDRAQVGELLAAVEALYQSMDNSLRFPSDGGSQSSTGIAIGSADVERDYRTVKCPMNFVKVKIDLAAMKSGQKLRVILGDGDPIRNVPRSVVEEGHTILAQQREGEVWSVLIEKK